MRILHTSHSGLPDPRIERAAFVAKAKGNQLHFLGIGNMNNPALDSFKTRKMMKRINNRQVAKDKTVRREWAIAVSEIDPDLIHANDIISALFCLKLGYPMVYDDHEYWSEQPTGIELWPFLLRLRDRPYFNSVAKWERQILKDRVVITVSDGIACEHRKYALAVFVLHNYCLKQEAENIKSNSVRDGAVYVGRDFTRSKFISFRDSTNLTDYVQFDTLTDLPRTELYERLSNYRFGLLPFRPVPYHRYADSSKLYDYLHCGLHVITTPVLYEAHNRLPFLLLFDDYSEIPKLLKRSDLASPDEIMDYARNNLVWEKQENHLFEAYRMCLENVEQ